MRSISPDTPASPPHAARQPAEASVVLWRGAGGPSARRAGLAGLLVAALLLLPAPALAGTFRVFGPQDVLRTTGAPVTETRSFTVRNPATTFTLTIYNGGMQDADFERVSSSVITVNGVQVVGPSEFNQTVVWIAKPVTPLQGSNVLSVELRGKPNGQVTLVIDGVDNDPPAITASVDPPPNAAGWHHADVTVSFTCSDAISGVASCPAPVVVRAEGSQQVVTGTATDVAGNTASASVAIHLDTTPPVLTSTLTPEANAAGWSQADTTVTFAATDTLSGIATISAPVLVTAEGAAQVVTGTATDAAGNSATLTATVKLDKTPPTLTPVVTPAPNAAGWHMRDVTVSVTATDSLSGLATATPPVVVTTEGAGQVVAGSATDVAGHTTTATVTLSLDTTPPTITAAVAPPPNAAGWHRAAPTVTFTCHDLLSGLATCPAPVTVVTEGAGQAIAGTATDVAGNSASVTATVSLDTTAPVVTITAPPEGAFIPTPSVTVTGTVSEVVASLTVNGVPATVTAGAFTVEVPLTLSTTTLVAVATDPAGNTGSATRTITLDTTPPVVRILTPAAGQVVRTPTVTVTGTIDDPTAAVTVNGVAATIAEGIFTAAGVALGAGATPLTAEARDPAGNVGTDQVVVTFDGTPPTVSLTAPVAVTAGVPVTLEVQATDNLGLATIDLLVDGRLVASGSTSPVTTTFLIPPDRAVGDTLTVTARAVDLAGAVTQQLATMSVTAAAVGPGFLRGLVLDDTTGLPLAGATVTVSGTGTTPIAPQTTGADGQYAVTLEPGSARVRVTKAGSTLVERTVPVRSGLLTVVPDARLTPRAALAPLLGAAGGVAANADQTIRLAVPAGALAGDVTLEAARVSGQGLAARLPLGWSPLLAVDLDPADTALAAPAGLTLRLPEPLQALLPPGSTVPAARYDPGPQAWVALAPGTVTADGLAVELALPGGLGPVVLLQPDAAPTTPPAATAGQPLAGVAVVAIPETATAASELTPKAVPPGQATATMTIGIASATPLPSGTTVQGVVTETYALRSGRSVTPPGFTQDVVLYACDATGCGPANTLGARIPVTPSKRFTLQELAVGSVTVAVQTPEAEGPGTLIGPAGGSVTASDGTVLTIPATALASETVVALTPVAEADLRVGLPAGVEVLRAVRLDLTRATLSRTAELAFPVPEGLTPTDQVLIARVLEVNGLLHLQVVALGRLDGGLLTSRGSVAGASLPGLTSGGTFVFLRAATPFGFVTGTVRDAAGAARPGVVVTSAAGFADVSRADGRYVLATTAGSVTVTATDAATGQGASQPVTVTAGAATPQPLTVATIPPRVVRVSPAAGATNVPVQTPVEVTFSKPVARTSVTSATLVLSSAAGAVDTVVTLSATGTVATLYPTRALAPQTPYTVQATTAITDAQGAPLAAPVTSPFTTVDTTPPPPPAAGAITVSFPDLNQEVTVTATQGTAEPNALVTVLNLSSGSAASATVQANGAFTATLFAFLGDELVVVIKDAAGNQIAVSPGPYKSTAGEYVVTAQGGVVEGDGGVRVTLPAGALDVPTRVRVRAIGVADLPGPVPSDQTFLAGVRLESERAFTGEVKLTAPVPAGATIPANARPYLARYELVDGVQTPVMVDSARVVNGELTTSSPPFIGPILPGTYLFLLPPSPYPARVTGRVTRETLSGATEPVAHGVIRWGAFAAPAVTDAQGHYTLALYPSGFGPQTFTLTATDLETRVSQSRSVTVNTWVPEIPWPEVPGGVYTLNFLLGAVPAAADLRAPTVTLAFEAPTLRSGRLNTVAAGGVVTLLVRVSDDRGVVPESITLRVNGEPLQVTSDPIARTFTASFAPPATNVVYTVLASARDPSGNEGTASAALIAVDGPPPSSLPGPPAVLTAGLYPPNGATNVNVFTEINVPFSEGIVNLSADAPTPTVLLEELDPAVYPGVQTVKAQVPVDLLRDNATASLNVTLRPRQSLKFGTPYRVTLRKTLADQEGLPLAGPNGQPLASDLTSVFVTKGLDPAGTVAGSIKAVELLGQHAVLLDRDQGVRVVDVADAAHPLDPLTAARPFVLTPGGPGAYQGLAVVPTFVYEASPGNFRSLDLAIVVGFRWIAGEGAQGVMGFVDVTDRRAPVRLGDVVLSQGTVGLPMRVQMVDDRYALVSSASQGVLVVDVAHALAVITSRSLFSPSEPGSVVGLFDAGGELTFPVGLVRYRGGALVGDLTHGLYRLDLSTLPALTGERLVTTRVFRLQVVESFPVVDPTTKIATPTDLALITNSDGLTVVTLGTVPPTVAPPLPLPGGTPFEVAVDRDRGLAFVGSGAAGVTVLDLTTPASPVQIGARAAEGMTNGGVALDAQFAYVAGTKGLQVVAFNTPGLEIHLTSPDVVTDLTGRPLAGLFLIRNDTASPPNPVMPRITLEARLPESEAWRKPFIENVRWEITVDYRLTVPGDEGRRGDGEPKTSDDKRPLKRSRFLGRQVEGTIGCDGLRVPAPATPESQKCHWRTELIQAPLNTPIPIPWPTGFVGGGELQIRAIPVLAGSSAEDRSLATEARLTTGTAGRVFLNGVPYAAGASPGSPWPRIEGELAYPLGPSSYPTNARGLEGNGTSAAGFLGAVISYLRNPAGANAATAQAVQTTVGQPLLFQVFARLESLVHEPYTHFRKLQFTVLSPKTGQPAQAVYPMLNAKNESQQRRVPTTDGGFGLMQLTDPPPTYTEIWDWRRNIDSAVDRLQGMLTGVERRLDRATQRGVINPFTRKEWLRYRLYARYRGEGYWIVDRDGAWARPKPRKPPGEPWYADRARAIEEDLAAQSGTIPNP